MSLYQDLLVGTDEIQFVENAFTFGGCCDVMDMRNIIHIRFCKTVVGSIYTHKSIKRLCSWGLDGTIYSKFYKKQDSPWYLSRGT